MKQAGLASRFAQMVEWNLDRFHPTRHEMARAAFRRVHRESVRYP